MADHPTTTRTAVSTDGDGGTLDELEYYRRLQPSREEPFEAGATLLSSLGLIFGLASLLYWPMWLGAIAMTLALIGLAFAGPRTRFPRLALIVATICWFVGSLVGVLLERDVW